MLYGLRLLAMCALLVSPSGATLARAYEARRRDKATIKEKSPYFRTSSCLEYGGEGGIDSLCSPLLGPSMGLAPLGPTQALFKNAPGVFVRAACSLRSQSVQLAVASCRTPFGDSHPPLSETIKEKSPYFRTSSCLEYGGEGGIRTPDTLPYTHFPGVLLQPLGHLTILFCCLTAWGATGRYYRELR